MLVSIFIFFRKFVLVLLAWSMGLINTALAQSSPHTSSSTNVSTATKKDIALQLVALDDWQFIRKKILIAASMSAIVNDKEFNERLNRQRDALLIDSYVKDYISKNPSTESELEVAYAEEKKVFSDLEYRASQILIDSKDKIQGVQRMLDKKIAFEKVARRWSEDPFTAGQGGDIGWFSEIPEVPEILATVSKLEINEISPPVQSAYGFHFLKLTDKRIKAMPTLSELRDSLEKKIAVQKIRKLALGMQ
ncbi:MULTISPECIES: peptidylprolyl isomerase [unclassified Polaromonas]|uniref:foldase protein PrsA n=1 Tax=unclassified Polaromonas TaxID=2638319 RepID=UPI000F084777|nr:MULTISPECIES: peptidylprolyl isomerase [unclassified Polaromonas]AYQ30274.1 hypothetical protein DT070_21040 [Polaromonas sp. SP1]QGJ18610.1 hypothetical protein F7R28_09540 [Polaromonas sp. Pch-P]